MRWPVLPTGIQMFSISRARTGRVSTILMRPMPKAPSLGRSASPPRAVDHHLHGQDVLGAGGAAAAHDLGAHLDPLVGELRQARRAMGLNSHDVGPEMDPPPDRRHRV